MISWIELAYIFGLVLCCHSFVRLAVMLNNRRRVRVWEREYGDKIENMLAFKLTAATDWYMAEARRKGMEPGTVVAVLARAFGIELADCLHAFAMVPPLDKRKGQWQDIYRVVGATTTQVLEGSMWRLKCEDAGFQEIANSPGGFEQPTAH